MIVLPFSSSSVATMMRLLLVSFLIIICLTPHLLHAGEPPNFITEWGVEGSMPGELLFPLAMVLDHQNRLVFADGRNNRIQRFDRTGNYLDGWGSPGSGPGQLSYIAGVAIAANGDVFVTDMENHRVSRFTDSGEFILGWGGAKVQV